LAADWASRIEALDKSDVGGMAVIKNLDGDLTTERLVVGEVHLGHSAQTNLAHDAVAAVEYRADQVVRGIHGRVLYECAATAASGQPLLLARTASRAYSTATCRFMLAA